MQIFWPRKALHRFDTILYAWNTEDGLISLSLSHSLSMSNEHEHERCSWTYITRTMIKLIWNWYCHCWQVCQNLKIALISTKIKRAKEPTSDSLRWRIWLFVWFWTGVGGSWKTPCIITVEKWHILSFCFVYKGPRRKYFSRKYFSFTNAKIVIILFRIRESETPARGACAIC